MCKEKNKKDRAIDKDNAQKRFHLSNITMVDIKLTKFLNFVSLISFCFNFLLLNQGYPISSTTGFAELQYLSP